jgi:protein-tyrosine phosphatase
MMEKVMDCAQILPNIYLGSAPRNTSEIDELLQSLRLTAVINLQSPSEMIADKFNWSTMRTHYAVRGVRLFHLPVKDLNPLDLQRRLPECLRIFEALMVSGHTVYVHCRYGTYRAPTLVLAYLHMCRGWSLKDAFLHIAEQRDCAPDQQVVTLAKTDMARGSVA